MLNIALFEKKKRSVFRGERPTKNSINCLWNRKYLLFYLFFFENLNFLEPFLWTERQRDNKIFVRISEKKKEFYKNVVEFRVCFQEKGSGYCETVSPFDLALHYFCINLYRLFIFYETIAFTNIGIFSSYSVE